MTPAPVRYATTCWQRTDVGRPVSSIRFRTVTPMACLGLLGSEAAGSQPWSHQRFVAAHCCFYVTAQVISLEGGIDRSRLSTSQRVNGTAR